MTPLSPDSPSRASYSPTAPFGKAAQADEEQLSPGDKEAWWIFDVIGHCVRAGSDFEGCLHSILKTAMSLTSAEMGSIRLLDMETGDLKLIAQEGMAPAVLEALGTLRPDEAPQCGLTLRRGERVVVEDVALSEAVKMPGLASTFLHAGIRALQSTPLVSTEGAVVGVVSTLFARPRRPSPRQLRLLDVLARQAADYVLRIQGERELQYRTQLLEALLQNAPLAVCLMDGAFTIRHSNPAAVQILGESGMVGHNFEELMRRVWSREFADAMMHKLRRTLQSGGLCTLPEERAPRSGHREPEYYEWRAHRIELPEGVPGVACYFRDISVRVRARLKLHDQEERLRRVVRLAAAGQIASSLAHEINNPLSSVTNALYLLGEHAELQGNSKELVHAATAELARVSRIVKQSLSYYRIGAVVSELDLGNLVEERIATFAERFATARIDLKKRMMPVAHMTGFVEEIRQVIDNLLVNALEAMPGGGHLTVSLSHSRTWSNQELRGIRLTVADTGLGIPRDNLRRIFEPFFTTKPEGGRGLGLWVVRGIVSKHEGTLSIRSREDRGCSGTVVSIVWPLTPSVPVVPGKRRRSAAG